MKLLMILLLVSFYFNLVLIDTIESLLLNLTNDNNAYGLQITKRIGKAIADRKKQYTPKMRKYKLFR